MSLFDYFKRKQKPTANVARERLQIILAREHAGRNEPDYLPALKQELLIVVAKYVHIDPDAIKVNLEREGDCEILELNIALPEEENAVA
ncbi:MAG TPA: cell division topological specificity factor MinE [Gammaproteobacteria bacterium]|nr:cell division topological specificity factor MinE [Gammaproteobacteria bacterium]